MATTAGGISVARGPACLTPAKAATLTFYLIRDFGLSIPPEKHVAHFRAVFHRQGAFGAARHRSGPLDGLWSAKKMEEAGLAVESIGMRAATSHSFSSANLEGGRPGESNGHVKVR